MLADPADPQVQDALTRACRICRAPKGHHCTNITNPQPLTGRLVHQDRTYK